LSWARRRVPGGEIAFEVFERDRLAAAGLIAGGVAFRLFLWLVPLGLVVAAILAFWVEADPAGLEEAVGEFGIGAATAQSATDAISEETHSRWYFLIVGLTLLVWSSMSAVRALRLAHFVAWGSPATKLRRPLAAGALFTIVTTGVLSVAALTSWLRAELGLVGMLAVFVLYAAAALALLVRLPHASAPWRALIPGAILLAVGSGAIHAFVVLYLTPKLGRSTQLYGSLGAASVILFWLFLTARLIVASAFLNASLWDRRMKSSRSS
jgi:uncharacterized BrkB/YihY/UPF0761 family membrane protein